MKQRARMLAGYSDDVFSRRSFLTGAGTAAAGGIMLETNLASPLASASDKSMPEVILETLVRRAILAAA